MAFHASGKIVASMLATGWLLSIGGPVAASSQDEAADPAPQYQPGQGLRLGDSGLTVGGYATAQYQDVKNSDSSASLSHLSMFIWWESEFRLKFFSEIDRRDTLSAEDQSEAGNRRYLSIERLYFDYTFNDALTLRAGKFLTPIGRWNQIHADPLVWTTSRPLISRDLFPDNATGLMALGNVQLLGRQADYTLYLSTGTELRPDPAQDAFNEAYGMRLNFPVNDNMQFGLSYASFDQRATSEEHKRLLGLDFVWSSHDYEVSGEGVYRRSNEGAGRDAKGGFIQAVVPLHERLSAVGRIETIRNPDLPTITRQWVLGLNYRSSHAMSFKVEIVHGSNNGISAPAAFLSSASVLF